MACKVGSFAKSTAAAPVAQAVTDVGFRPWALVLWTVGATANETWTASYLCSIGYSGRNAAGTITQGSMCAASQDAQATSNTTRANKVKALTIYQWGESLLAECDLASMDADGFTLTWTTNNASAYIINYMAIGGPDVTNAYVKAWSTGSGTGNKAITGVGFQPSVVLHLTNNTAAGSGANTAAQLVVGGMTSTAQWSGGFRANDAASTTDVWRICVTDKTIDAIDSAGLYSLVGTYVAMGADGFTVNISNSLGDMQLYSLCLQGGSYGIGSWQKTASSAPASQAVTGVGFQPDGVLFFTPCSNIVGTSGVSEVYFGIGATDGSNEMAAAIVDKDNSADSVAKSYSTSGKAIAVAKNSTPTVSGECDTSSLDADGFTLNWTTNYATADYIFYFAFSGGAIAPTVKPWYAYAQQ